MPVASAEAVAIASSAAVCVNYLYPKSSELSEVGIIGLKIVFVFSLIVGIICFIKTDDYLPEKFFNCFIGIIATPIVIAIFCFIFMGIKWVLS